MTALFHNVGNRLKDNFMEISGFSTAATITPLKLAPLIDSILSAAAVALVSGFIGAFAAHFAKKLIQKLKL